MCSTDQFFKITAGYAGLPRRELVRITGAGIFINLMAFL